jgi:hypothetical protein
MTLIPYTVDDEVMMDKLISNGVDGFIANYPVHSCVSCWGLRIQGWTPNEGRKAGLLG